MPMGAHGCPWVPMGPMSFISWARPMESRQVPRATSHGSHMGSRGQEHGCPWKRMGKDMGVPLEPMGDRHNKVTLYSHGVSVQTTKAQPNLHKD